MAFLQNNYGYNPLDEEEERKRREAALLADEAVASGGAQPGPVSFGDIFGQYADKRLQGLENRINDAGQMFANPQEALQKRLQLDQQEQIAAEATPVTQTIKTNPVTGEQEMTVKGNVRDLSAANPLTPTVSGVQAQPVSPTSLQMPQAQVPAPQTQMPQAQVPAPQARMAPPPAQGQIPADMAQRPVPAMNLPPVGAGVNVASNAPGLPQTQPPVQQPPAAVAAAPGASLAQISQAFTPTAERQTEPLTQQQINNDTLINARNEKDPEKRRQQFARLLTDQNVDAGTKALANQFIADDYIKQRNIAKANEDIENATPTDLARYMRETKKEGSYVKAILFARLGLTELAQKEQEKIDPTITMESATDGKGNKYTVGKDKFGKITTGFDSTGKKIGQETIATLSAAAMPTKAHLLPQSAGGLMQKTIKGPDGQTQTITGQVFTDPVTRETYFQAGNTKYNTEGLSTPAQNIQNVFGASQAQAAGKGAGEGFQVPPLSQFPGMQGQPQAGAQPQSTVPVDPQAVDRAQRDLQAIQNEVNRISPNDPKREEMLAIRMDEAKKLQSVIGQGAKDIIPPLWKSRQAAELSTAQGKANIDAAKEIKVAEGKPAAEARGKLDAKDINNQAFADSTYELIKPINDLIKQSTGSSIGAGVDKLASVIGASTKGQQAIAELEVLSYPLISNVPRFEGPQGVRDVELYERAAGDFANPNKPVKTRLAALNAMTNLLKKYDKEGKNDWTFGASETKNKDAGTTSSGNKYKRVQ